MATDIILFLKNKFMKDYREAIMEYGELPLHSHFQEIFYILQSKIISLSTPLEMRDWLYDVGFSLAECCMLSEDRELRAQKKKSTSCFFLVQTPKELLFLFKTRRLLLRLKRKLQSSGDAAVDSLLPSSSSMIRVLTEFSTVEASRIHGFDDDLRKIETMLLKAQGNDQRMKAIGIFGMGGQGKSTLAELVFNGKAVQEHFHPRIWIWLSEKLDLENSDTRVMIIKQMLECLTNDLILEDDLDLLLGMLHNQLSGQKYFIVLDNVYHVSDWFAELGSELSVDYAGGTTRLAHGLPRESGGAIMVTSRLEKVASRMVGEHNLHRLGPLSNADSCWSIIMDSIEHEALIGQDHPILLKMADEIVDKCDGLPLAAKLLAEIISTQIAKIQSSSSQLVEPLEIVLKVELHDDYAKSNAMKKICEVPGVQSVHFDSTNETIVLRGNLDPVKVVKKLRKFWRTTIISVSPVRKVLRKFSYSRKFLACVVDYLHNKAVCS